MDSSRPEQTPADKTPYFKIILNHRIDLSGLEQTGVCKLMGESMGENYLRRLTDLMQSDLGKTVKSPVPSSYWEVITTIMSLVALTRMPSVQQPAGFTADKLSFV